MSDKVKMAIEMEVTIPQGLALKAMFEQWNQYGSQGSSRNVAFYVDGDGNFQPKCKISFPEDFPELTDEMRKKAIVKEDDGDLWYDFDPVAWMLLNEKEDQQVRVKPTIHDLEKILKEPDSKNSINA